MALKIQERIAGVEFSKYEPTAYRSTPITEIKRESTLSEIASAISDDLEETDLYEEDPELPRYHVTLHRQGAESLSLKVTHSFIVSSDQCFYSPSKRLWRILEELGGTKRTFLEKLLGLKKGQRIEWEDPPCFEKTWNERTFEE